MLQLLGLRQHLQSLLVVQTLQHQSKGVADYESMQAVQYLSVQVTKEPTVEQKHSNCECCCVNLVHTHKGVVPMQVNALQKGFLTLSDALLEELGELPQSTILLFLGPCSSHLAQLCFAESVKQERDALTTALHEVRHDTSRKMAEMQQRFDHVYALMQDYQVTTQTLVRVRQSLHADAAIETVPVCSEHQFEQHSRGMCSFECKAGDSRTAAGRSSTPDL